MSTIIAVATAATDEFGAFTIPDVPSGPVSIVCRAANGSWSIRTSHVAL